MSATKKRNVNDKPPSAREGGLLSTVPTVATTPAKRPRRNRAPAAKKPIEPTVVFKPSDELGTLVNDLSRQYMSSTSWESFIEEFRGSTLLQDDLDLLPHPAGLYLQGLSKAGSPAKSTSPPWDLETKRLCLRRGAHKTANEHKGFIREEMVTNIRSKYWIVLPYHLIEHLEELRLSPLGIKEERDRRPRLVVDHTFHGVNQATAPLSPEEAMQYGATLHRILFRARHADRRHGPVYLAKYDVTDGFYNIHLIPRDALMLATILPQYDGEPPLIAIPLALTMGWTESPPTFCTITETICDLTNWNAHKPYVPPHRLEPTARSTDTMGEGPEDRDLPTAELKEREPSPIPCLPAPPLRDSDSPLPKPLTYTDVFVDDFIQALQGSYRDRTMMRRLLFHITDLVLRPNPNAPNTREERISVKKLLKGDGALNTRKVVLGWMIDTWRQTLELPKHRQERLLHLLQEVRSKKRISVKAWQSLLGELRFVAPGVPGSIGLFSALQLGLSQQEQKRIRITSHLKSHLEDFSSLVADLGQRPTRLGEIIPDKPRVIGATDASGARLGGVFFAEPHRPVLWRVLLPNWVTDSLITSENPSGTISINDLEQAAAILQHDLIAQLYDVRERSIANLVDNIATASRFRKGAVTSASAGAYLCGLQAMHQRHHRYYSESSYIPGEANVMADDASRLPLSDTDLLSHFNTTYPQSRTWRLCHPRCAMLTSVMQALQCKRSSKASWAQRNVSETATGVNGWSSAVPRISPRPSKALMSPTFLSSSSQCGGEAAKSPTATSPEGLHLYRQPWQPLERRSNGWLTKTHAKSKDLRTSSISSGTFTLPSVGKTMRLKGPGPSPQLSSSTWMTSSPPAASLPPKSRLSATSPSWPSSTCSAQANMPIPPPTKQTAKLFAHPSSSKTSASAFPAPPSAKCNPSLPSL